SEALSRQLAKEVQSVFAPIQRQTRIKVADFGRERGYVPARNIGRIRNDQVKPPGAGHLFQVLSTKELDTLRHLVSFRISASDLQRGFRSINGENPYLGRFGCQRNRDASASSAKIQSGCARRTIRRKAIQKLPPAFRKQLGLGSWN